MDQTRFSLFVRPYFYNLAISLRPVRLPRLARGYFSLGVIHICVCVCQYAYVIWLCIPPQDLSHSWVKLECIHRHPVRSTRSPILIFNNVSVMLNNDIGVGGWWCVRLYGCPLLLLLLLWFWFALTEHACMKSSLATDCVADMGNVCRRDEFKSWETHQKNGNDSSYFGWRRWCRHTRPPLTLCASKYAVDPSPYFTLYTFFITENEQSGHPAFKCKCLENSHNYNPADREDVSLWKKIWIRTINRKMWLATSLRQIG